MSLRRIASGLAIMAAKFSYAATASAQEKCDQIVLPDGTLLTCQVDATGQKVYVDNGGNSYPATTGGVGQFTVVDSDTRPCTAVLDVTAINLTSNNPKLGTIKTYLDNSRKSRSSVIRSNQESSTFPATEDIYFYAIAEVSSLPGKYRSAQELHFNSRKVTSFNPHKNEPFRLVEKVDFVDDNGTVVFTLTQADVSLSGK
jgi:hypothetical protein